jgi:hypothetical protein
MSKLETNTIDTISGTNTLQVGDGNVATINLGKSGDTINVPSGATLNVAGTVGTGLTNTPAFSAKMASGQAIPNGTHTTLVFGTENFDTDNAFDGTSTFTVPSGKGGKYYLFAQSGRQGWASNRFLIYLYKNGNTDLSAAETIASGTNYQTTATSAVVDLSAGDTVIAKLYQDNGSSQTTSSGDRSTFAGYKLT